MVLFIGFQLCYVMFLSSHSPELRQLSTTDLKFLEEGLDGQTNAFCDLDTILDDFQADHHILLTNPNQLLNGNSITLSVRD